MSAKSHEFYNQWYNIVDKYNCLCIYNYPYWRPLVLCSFQIRFSLHPWRWARLTDGAYPSWAPGLTSLMDVYVFNLFYSFYFVLEWWFDMDWYVCFGTYFEYSIIYNNMIVTTSAMFFQKPLYTARAVDEPKSFEQIPIIQTHQL